MLSFPMMAALFTLIVSSTVFIFYLSDVIRTKGRQNCTQTGTAILSIGSSLLADKGRGTRKARFMARDGKEYDVWVDVEFVDSKYFLCKTGEQVPICYDPEEPTLVIIGDDFNLNDKLLKSRQICKISAGVMVIAFCALASVLFR